MCFVDLAKAFDTVPRDRLFKVLVEDIGFDHNIIDTLIAIY